MKKGKIYIGLSMLAIAISCIGIVFFSNINMSKASPEENFRVEFKMNAPAGDKGAQRLVYDAVFETDYFKDSSRVYNMDLANISVRMAMAAATTSESYVEYGKAMSNISHVNDNNINYKISRNGYLTDVYKKMGFTKDVYYKYDKSLNDSSDTVAHAFATKDIYIDGKRYTLVNIAIRSSSYGAEWASNFNIRNKDGVTGFETAGKEIYEHLLVYLKNNRINKNNTKIWISGFSRGGAVANIAAAYINRGCESGVIKTDRENVYAYTFATPNGVYDPTETEIHKEIYDNIFNTVYETDVVATVAPQTWGYRRYGKVYVIPSIHISSRDMKKIEENKEIYNSDIKEADLNAVKEISKDYYQIRYGYNKEVLKEYQGKLFKGFTANKEMLTLADTLFSVFGSTVRAYEKNWQGVVTDILPFVIRKDRKYDEVTKQWVPYEDLKEYIVQKHGEEVLDEAIQEGIYSETQYEKSIEKVEELEETGAISKETEEVVTTVLDTYYGVRVTAVNYDITKEDIKDISSDLYSKLGEIFLKTMPITDNISCVKNHNPEFYIAYMNNYDVSTGKMMLNK